MSGLAPVIAAGLLSIVGAVGGALVGYFLGFRRHKRETNWALKQQAYVDLVLSLQQMRDHYQEVFENDVGERSYSEQYMRQRRRQYDSARGMFQRSRALAFVLLGPAVSASLDGLNRKLRANDYHTAAEWADDCAAEVGKALEAIKKRAAAELAV